MLVTDVALRNLNVIGRLVGGGGGVDGSIRLNSVTNISLVYTVHSSNPFKNDYGNGFRCTNSCISWLS